MSDKTEFEERLTRMTVTPKGADLMSEQATHVSVDDEGGGEFVVLEQNPDTGTMKICINPEEWPALRSAIDRMIGACRPAKA